MHGKGARESSSRNIRFQPVSNTITTRYAHVYDIVMLFT